MAEVATDIVRHLRELAIGDLVERGTTDDATTGGRSCRPYPPWGMFRILHSGSGTRKLVDFEALPIRLM
jgi:hypothetical protein